jgi:hypothetical protein
MAEFPKEFLELVGDPDSVKVVATTDKHGAPHVVVKGSLRVEGAHLAFGEVIEDSDSGHYLVRSIWFDRPVAVNVTKGDKSWQVKGRTYKCLIVGPLLKEFLLRERAQRGPDADLNAVWLIEPTEIRDESLEARRQALEARRPLFGRHLDRASIVAESRQLAAAKA